MLAFDDTQIQRLRAEKRARFEKGMCSHVARFAPRHAQVLGPDGLLVFVQEGIAAAERRGFTTYAALRTWLESAMTLGSHFDTDPIFAGLFAGVFTDGDPVLQMSRADMLYGRLCEYIEAVLGPEREHAKAAMLHLRVLADEPVPLAGNIRDLLLARLPEVFPTKWESLGETRHRVMLDATLGRAVRVGVRDRECLAVWGVMALVMGHRFDSDPLYPWVSRTLRDARYGVPDSRVLRLKERARVYLDAVVKGF